MRGTVACKVHGVQDWVAASMFRLDSWQGVKNPTMQVVCLAVVHGEVHAAESLMGHWNVVTGLTVALKHC
jgi:hypothetical protein